MKLHLAALQHWLDALEANPPTAVRGPRHSQTAGQTPFVLHEKGGKFHPVPAHHQAAELVDAYLAAAELEQTHDAPGADKFEVIAPKISIPCPSAMSRDRFRLLLVCRRTRPGHYNVLLLPQRRN